MAEQHDAINLEKASFATPTPLHSANWHKNTFIAVPINISWENVGRITRQYLFSPPLLLLLFLGNLIARGVVEYSPAPSVRPRESDYYDAGAPFAPYTTQKLWAAYSPYYSVEKYKPPPEDCRLTQVNIVR
jgi:hypothetical protein